jgi:type II secretory pathway component GspD/PulD (secretin)
MRSAARFLLWCAIAASLAAPVAAQDPLSKRVSLDLKAMAPADAFEVLASSTGLKVVVDPAVTSPIDIVVRNVTARTALTTMCESIGCAWTVAAVTLSIGPIAADKRVRVMSGYTVKSRPAMANRLVELLGKPLPADMKFENAPLAKVSERISQALGVKVVLSVKDPGLQTVTIDLSNTTLKAGLRKLSEMVSGDGKVRVGLSIEVDPDGKSPSRVVMISVAAMPVVVKKK